MYPSFTKYVLMINTKQSQKKEEVPCRKRTVLFYEDIMAS